MKPNHSFEFLCSFLLNKIIVSLQIQQKWLFRIFERIYFFMQHRNEKIIFKLFFYSFLLNSLTLMSQTKDVDNNEYQFIQIGDKNWSTSNLKTTHFANGDKIPFASNDSLWFLYYEKKIPAYCYMLRDAKNKSIGLFYNYYALIDKRGIAPKNCIVADSSDYRNLINYLGGETQANKKARSATGWKKSIYFPDENGSNESKLNIRPSAVIWSQGWEERDNRAAFLWCRGGLAIIRIDNYNEFEIDDGGEKTYGGFDESWGMPIRFMKK